MILELVGDPQIKIVTIVLIRRERLTGITYGPLRIILVHYFSLSLRPSL